MLDYGFRHANLKVFKFPAGDKQVPAVRVAGEWLRDLGFQPGDKVILSATHGQIRIIKEYPMYYERKADELVKTNL